MAFIDYFLKPEDKPVDSVQNTQPAAQPQQIQIQQVSMPTPTVTSDVQTSDHSEDVVKTLWNTLIERNLPGPDFLELKQNASALANLGLSIEKQYEGAFNVLKTQYPDFDKQTIINSIDKYISFVIEEQENGKQQCAKKREDAIGTKQTRVAQLTENSQDILKKIDALKTEYDNVLKSIDTLNTEIENSTAELNRQEQLFNNSIEVVLGSLNADKQKISSLNI